MKKMRSKISLFLSLILLSSFSFNFFSSTPVSAARCEYFLGMPSWDCNTNFDVESGSMPNSEALQTGIWTAVANVFSAITILASYLVIGFVIYGGYLYIFSGGDSGKVAAGRQTLTRAFIGLAIVMLAHVILSSIRIALGFNISQDCTSAKCIDPGDMFVSAIQWVIGIAGAVSAIFIVYGGIAYITSTGDAQKVLKARNIILYSLIGLIIVALSMTITAFVSNIIREGAFTPPPSIIANISLTKKGIQ